MSGSGVNDQNDERFDDGDVRGIALAAFHEHEASVTPAETEAALGAVRSRVDAGDMGGSSPALAMGEMERNRRPWWMVFGAAAAVVGMLALGLVAVIGGGANDPLIPGTVPSTVERAEPNPAPPPTGPPSIEVTTTAPSTTEQPVASGIRTIAVDSANLPQSVEPRMLATVPLEPNPNRHAIDDAIGRVAPRPPATSIATATWSSRSPRRSDSISATWSSRSVRPRQQSRAGRPGRHPDVLQPADRLSVPA